jgi:putative nucleotidyltransferase with HDIG domain
MEKFYVNYTEAQNELKTAVQLNSGKWEQHSISVAENARLIAEKIDYLDSDKAYTMGLLHDIGRRAGVTGIKHIFDGYDYMMSLGETEIARICLTHSFPLKNINTFSGKYDCSDEQLVFLQEFLNSVEYNDYDILIQLCDAISLPDGACIMEKRFVDVAIRNGLTEHTIDKWKAFIKAKKHFDKLCGCNIYSLLPNVLENSTIDLI